MKSICGYSALSFDLDIVNLPQILGIRLANWRESMEQTGFARFSRISIRFQQTLRPI
jgi:hypothetical protein